MEKIHTGIFVQKLVWQNFIRYNFEPNLSYYFVSYERNWNVLDW